MIAVIGSFRLPADRIEEALPAMARFIQASRAEPGCTAYGYAQDVLDPGLFRVSEEWASRADLDGHFSSPHMTEWRGERETLGMTERQIWAVTGGERELL